MKSHIASGMTGKLIKALLSGILIYVMTVTVFSLLVWLTPLPERWSQYYSWFGLCLSGLFVGLYGGYHSQKRGFLIGALMTLILILVILFGYGALFQLPVDQQLMRWVYLLPLLCGSLGGMLGVNTRS